MIENKPQIATLIKKITDVSLLQNRNVVKVVTDKNNYALYFSRQPIPFLRNQPNLELWVEAYNFYQHIGIYGFSKKTLAEIGILSPGILEMAESLEQLRWMENGYHILTAITDYQSIAIDTPEDLVGLSPK